MTSLQNYFRQLNGRATDADVYGRTIFSEFKPEWNGRTVWDYEADVREHLKHGITLADTDAPIYASLARQRVIKPVRWVADPQPTAIHWSAR
jgi:hypothetical protein